MKGKDEGGSMKDEVNPVETAAMRSAATAARGIPLLLGSSFLLPPSSFILALR
jgi:hypothetical protein